MTRSLLAYINDAHVGTLMAENNIWIFEYTQAWAESEEGYDLSPALPRINTNGKANRLTDGSTDRPVQWYFDNLLPEEGMRTVLAEQAHVAEGDAFGLLEYYGRESAGSLTLLRDGESLGGAGMRHLSLDELSARIRAMPRIPLNANSPKRMSLAGAQHKLAVIYKDGKLYEPDGPTASTHILKPQHQEKTLYQASVVNEYFTMRVAGEVGLNVPHVKRLFCPEPVYLIERFDRVSNAGGGVERLHVIDGCQILNIDRVFKYAKADVGTLASIVGFLEAPAAGRQWFFDWLVFNILMGNGDNHLKNISFMVSSKSIVLSPCYDLLSTAAYDTKAVDSEFGKWPETEFPIRFNSELRKFSSITREDVIAAGEVLGLNEKSAIRRLDKMIKNLPIATEKIRQEIISENSHQSEEVKIGLERDSRMLGIIKKHILETMVNQLMQKPEPEFKI